MPRKLLAYSALALLLASCMKLPEDKPPQLYWPMPPEKPKIRFVDLIMGSLDVAGSRANKFKRLLFGEEGDVEMRKPSFVKVREGVVYVTDLRGVHVFDFNRHRYSTIGSGKLRGAQGIALDSAGTVYIADAVLKKIQIFRPDGSFKNSISLSGIMGVLGGMDIDEERGRLYVANTRMHNVLVVSLEGEHLFTIGERGTGGGNLNYPYDVAVGPGGDVFVVDSGNFRVQVFDHEGRFIRAFGSIGTIPGSFARPKGIALSQDGYIFVVDAAFGNFQIFDREGRHYLWVGETGEVPGMFLLPMGIAIDKDDKIYIVDQLNRRVQIFEYLREGPGSDKQQRPKARFSSPASDPDSGSPHD